MLKGNLPFQRRESSLQIHGVPVVTACYDPLETAAAFNDA